MYEYIMSWRPRYMYVYAVVFEVLFFVHNVVLIQPNPPPPPPPLPQQVVWIFENLNFVVCTLESLLLKLSSMWYNVL